MEQTVIYQPIIKIKDDLFNVDNISQYQLCIKPDPEFIELAVFDTKIARCLVYEKHQAGRKVSYAQLVGELGHLQRNHAFLGAGYWKKVFLLHNNPHYTFVPEDYHHPSYSASFLRLTSNINQEPMAIQQNPHESQRCYCHFAIPKPLQEWAVKRFGATKYHFVHQTSAILEGLLTIPDKLDGSNIHLFIDKEYLTIFFFRNGNLQYVNTFQHQNPSDIVYFLLLSMKEWGLEASWCNCWLYGDVNKTLVATLQQYVQKVTLSSRLKGINLGYRFDELDEWKAFDMLSVYHWGKMISATK